MFVAGYYTRCLKNKKSIQFIKADDVYFCRKLLHPLLQK